MEYNYEFRICNKLCVNCDCYNDVYKDSICCKECDKKLKYSYNDSENQSDEEDTYNTMNIMINNKGLAVLEQLKYAISDLENFDDVNQIEEVLRRLQPDPQPEGFVSFINENLSFLDSQIIENNKNRVGFVTILLDVAVILDYLKSRNYPINVEELFVSALPDNNEERNGIIMDFMSGVLEDAPDDFVLYRIM